MSALTTKFSIGDLCYTFDSSFGIIHRHIVHEIHTVSKTIDLEITYVLTNSIPEKVGRLPNNPEYEQNLLTEAEVKDLANLWLINKSVNIFSAAGL